MLDPELAAVLLAFGLAGLVGLPGLWRAARRSERVCARCGRPLSLDEHACDCD
ncbi:MAG TPA: hypothetical protein VFK62_08985 [Gaiellaceae bacterium]|nr:hypothetical protein [Gaiellaceae bacterium]